MIRRAGKGAEASIAGFRAALALGNLHPLAKSAPQVLQSNFTALGHARVVEYQNEHYGTLFLQRLKNLNTDHANTNETARWLALWMAFDDIIRVAQLKVQGARFERVRGEVKAGDRDIVKLYDHFKLACALDGV